LLLRLVTHIFVTQPSLVSAQALIAQNAAKEGQPPPEVTSLAKLRTDCVVIPTQNGNQLVRIVLHLAPPHPTLTDLHPTRTVSDGGVALT
jgi:hypothetical protein